MIEDLKKAIFDELYGEHKLQKFESLEDSNGEYYMHYSTLYQVFMLFKEDRIVISTSDPSFDFNYSDYTYAEFEYGDPKFNVSEVARAIKSMYEGTYEPDTDEPKQEPTNMDLNE